jgi:pimeloyl-[acyl-carrier protein] methyl ester esterase
MKKTKIFLLIGLTKESGHWDESFVSTIKSLFNTDELVAFDIPGCGKHLSENTPTSIDKIVTRMRELHFDDINTDSDTENILISISLGGMIGTEWTKLFPDDFQRMVIINSSFKNLSPLFKRVRPWGVKKFLKVFFSKTPVDREKHIIELCANNKSVHSPTLEKWSKIALERPVTNKNILNQTFAGSKFKVTHVPKIPVFIIAAKHDKLAHYSCSEMIQKKWGSELTIIDDENIGHGVHLDAPEQLAQLIHKWCENTQNA